MNQTKVDAPKPPENVILRENQDPRSVRPPKPIPPGISLRCSNCESEVINEKRTCWCNVSWWVLMVAWCVGYPLMIALIVADKLGWIK